MHAPFQKLESTDSVAFLGPSGVTGSSVATSVRDKPSSDDGDAPPTAAAPLRIAVSLRRGRVLLLTTLMVGAVVSLILVLREGVDVLTFDASTKNATDREKLLDNYNSYSGNVASAFSRPIEIGVAVLAQLITLRFMANSYTQPSVSWRQMAIPIGLSAGIGYMISNGFNAVNVQLRSMEIHAVIMASDLAVPSNISETVAARTTTVTHTVSELSPRNLVINTVLRNAVLPRVTFKQTICDWRQTRFETTATGELPLPTIDYGFTQRDWQSRILQEALPATTLKVVVNPTNKTANTNVKSADLPMNASLAADLFLYAMNVGPNVFPWGGVNSFVERTELDKRYPPNTPKEKQNSFVEKAAVVTALLPPSDQGKSELEQRDWFLKAMTPAVIRQFNGSVNTSRSDIGITFSHVTISPTIDFDAVTFEVELDPKLLATLSSRDNSTHYTELLQASPPGGESDCGPWPALCLVKKPLYQAKASAFAADPFQQVHAFSSCATNGSETLMSKSFGNPIFQCENVSTASIMVMSVGKRLVADSFVQNKSQDDGTPRSNAALVTNLRKIYTITIGRLSWRLQDLAQVFGADCGTKTTSHECLGLHMPLSSSSLSASGIVAGGEAKNQSLVVNVDGLPINAIMPSTLLYAYKPRPVPLVEVSESPSQTTLGGDILLPHNIQKVVWTNETVKTDCDADFESLLYSKLNNHIYIEHGFQEAYTAATFFLLQNAVVKDAIAAGGNAKAKTLNFDGNTQDIVAVVSTPLQNTLLTLAGCGFLFACVVLAVGKASFASHDSDPLAGITAPQAIARVMMDEQQFPAYLLHRRVVDDQGETLQHRRIEKFTISHLTVAQEAGGNGVYSTTK